MNSPFYFLYVGSLFLLSAVYFRLAKKYDIVDLPNHRSMHDGATVRGGGIIVLIGVVIMSVFSEEPTIYFMLGLLLVGATGFIDDLVDLPAWLRMSLQAISIALLLSELQILSLNPLLLIGIIIVASGVLNAFNFMDGINGLTSGYSLVVIFSLMYVNVYEQPFIESGFLIAVMLALFVFNYFNFRNKAVCFAGDVGSLSIAFIIIYLITKLVIESGNIAYILFLTLYGIDTIFTIIQRLILRQNIFEAHKMHLFQVATTWSGKSHLVISGVYMMVQLLINVVIIAVLPLEENIRNTLLIAMLLALAMIYVLLKRKMIPKVA